MDYEKQEQAWGRLIGAAQRREAASTEMEAAFAKLRDTAGQLGILVAIIDGYWPMSEWQIIRRLRELLALEK